MKQTACRVGHLEDAEVSRGGKKEREGTVKDLSFTGKSQYGERIYRYKRVDRVGSDKKVYFCCSQPDMC